MKHYFIFLPKQNLSSPGNAFCIISKDLVGSESQLKGTLRCSSDARSSLTLIPSPFLLGPSHEEE